MLVGPLLFVAIFGYVNANNVKQHLQRVPAPALYFNEQAALGRWYVQYRIAGCNYHSSDNIKDYSQNLVRRGQGRLISYETWRNDDLCNTLASLRIRQKTPGVYTIKDPIGAIWSGTGVYVAIDYKRYKILWGCAKMSVRGDACDDPFLNVYTRAPKADPETFEAIDYALRQIFGISLGSLQRIYYGMRKIFKDLTEFTLYARVLDLVEQ